ncbi:MAG: motility associated factor glycosyltransferase family protein, partial [Spirochaetales bacterium]|nr:motility associated factor glycosyltransferase family protein [Spirochaetales bacterium]
SGKYKGHYIHSRHNPLRESTQLIERETKGDISCALFYGFGLGYHIEAFMKKYPSVPVLIIEPEPSFFHKALESRDLTSLFQSTSLLYYINPDPDNLIEFIEQLPLSNIQIIRLRSMYGFTAGYYKQVDGIIQSYLSRKEVNVNTLKRFGKLWVNNLVHNVGELIKKPGITRLENELEGIPSLVLASGPSLELILPHLPELKKRMILISVDTSLRACLAQKVEPDFLIVVDPQYWNSRHLDWLSCKNALLLSESSTHPRVFRDLTIDGFFASSFFPLGIFFESIVGDKGKIGAGGSVATSAWDFARILGTSPIFMAGLDLGFPHKKTHFHGAYFEECFHQISDRYSPMEHKSFTYIRDGKPFPVISNNGSTVLTDQRMIIYKWWFESQMNAYPSLPTYSLSPGGVAIPGIMVRDVKDLLNLPLRREDIDEKMKRIRSYTHGIPDHDKVAAKLKRAIEELLTNLHLLADIADEGITTTEKAISHLSHGKIPPSFVEKLNKIDKKISSESSRVIAGFLIQPVIQGLLHTSTHDKTPGEILAFTKELYTELKSSCDYHYKALIKAEKKF